MKSARQFWREFFCENGVASSKRLVGGISMLVVLGCVIYLTISEGCTECVEGLLQVLIITACSLLGLSSVTSIWKNGSASVNKENKKLDEEDEQ